MRGARRFFGGAADEYLRRRRKRAIADQYAKAYRSDPGLGEEFNGWEDEGAWPEL